MIIERVEGPVYRKKEVGIDDSYIKALLVKLKNRELSKANSFAYAVDILLITMNGKTGEELFKSYKKAKTLYAPNKIFVENFLQLYFCDDVDERQNLAGDLIFKLGIIENMSGTDEWYEDFVLNDTTIDINYDHSISDDIRIMNTINALEIDGVMSIGRILRKWSYKKLFRS